MPKRIPTSDPQIIQYVDGTYYVRIGDKERSLKTKDFAKACKRKEVALAKLRASEGSSKLKIKDLWPDYGRVRELQFKTGTVVEITRGQAKRVKKGISEGTFKEIQYLWNAHLSPFWSDVRIDKALEEDKWQDYVDQCLVIDLANHRKVFLGFLKWCKKKKYIKYVPDLEIPGVERRPRRVLKPHEINLLFQHAKGSLLIFISMYLFMGMRRKEIMTLKWSDIHLADQFLVLRKSEVKTRVGRSLPINYFVHELLIERQLEQKAHGLKTEFVFPNAASPKRHADVGGLKTAWHTVRVKCRWPKGYITPHDLRATFEAYAHKSKDFTDTQREKMAGAAIDVQKKTYVNFDAHDVRGLENVVQVDGLADILSTRLKDMGKARGEQSDGRVH